MCSARVPGVDQALREEDVDHREQQQRVGAGADEVVLVGLLGGAGAPRVDHDDLAAALANRPQPPAHVGRRHQAAVGVQRVGAEDQQVLGAVDVGDGNAERGAEHVPGRDLLGHLVDRAGGEDVASSPAPSAEPARRGCWRSCGRPGCRRRRRPRRGRARSSSGGRRPSISAKASSQVASSKPPSRLISGVRTRSESESRAARLAPLGQMKPRLKTSAASPRIFVTRSPATVNSSPQVASQSGQVAKRVVASEATHRF